MNRNIRWLLTESKISSLDPDTINRSDNKLICYHLTSHENWASYNPDAERLLSNPKFIGPEQEIFDDDSRATKILKQIKNKRRVQKTSKEQVEELVIMDMIDDPYTDTSGFSSGSGDYHGKGLYTCYKFNPAIARMYGDICLVFEVDISRFLILAEDLAKAIHGESWTVKDQLIKLYSLNQPDPEEIEKFKKDYDSFLSSDLKMSKLVDSRDRTADTSQKIIEFFGKENIAALYDGIILFGDVDGPVCVSFYPKYDAKIIGLGRLDKKSVNANVDWYDSLDNFVGGIARNKLDFETMNAIAEENTDALEKSQMKESERPKLEIDMFIRAAFDSRQIFNVIKLYNDVSSQDKREEIEDYFLKYRGHFNSDLNISDLTIDNSLHNQMFLNVIKKLKKSDVSLKIVLTDVIKDLVSCKIQLLESLIKFALDFIHSKEYEKGKWGSFTKYAKNDQYKILVNILEYLKIFPVSNELESEIKSKIENKELNAKEKYENFLSALENNKIKSRGIQSFLNEMNDDTFLFNYITKQLSQSEIKNLVNIIILNYCNNPKIKSLTEKTLLFVLYFIFREDIVLSKQMQEAFISKIAKSHYDVKKEFSNYKHIELDCFIRLFEADLKKGGLGSGKVYSKFHDSPNIYKLLYQHKEIVNLFARSAKSGVMRLIIKNITLSLQGNSVPLSAYSSSFVVYNDYFTFSSSVGQEINLSDAQWFNYFLNTMRTSPSIKMLKKPLNLLEKTMRQKNMISGDPSLDLNHKVIFGKSLKEVYKKLYL